jgi:hypothetical protein
MESITDDFTTEFAVGGVRYVLPRRELGKARHVGWFLAGMGLFGTLFMIGWMWMPLMEGLKMVNKQEGIGFGLIGFGLLGLFGLVPAVGMLVIGLAVVAHRTRCVVEVAQGKLFSTERLLFLRWRRKCPTERIRRLRVTAGEAIESEAEDVSQWIGDSRYAIAAECGDAKPFVVAPVYPRQLLIKLAEELAPRIEAEMESGGLYKSGAVSRDEQTRTRKVEVVDEEPSIKKPPPMPTQPLDSDVAIERREDGLTIRVPPVGIWRGSKGLLFFSVLWMGFVAVFAIVILLTIFGAIEGDADTNPWLMLLFLIPFAAVGVATLVIAINIGRRHADIATADGSLLVVHHSIFRKQVRQWTVEQLEKICVGPSGVEVNDVPVMEVQIQARTGKEFGFLSERQDDELAWIAAELNRSLSLDAFSSESDDDVPLPERAESGQVVVPEESEIWLQRTGTGWEIDISPVGVRKYLGAIIVGLIFILLGFGVAVGVASSQLRNGFQAGDVPGLIFITIWTLIFAGGGLSALLMGLIAGRRRYEVRVAGGQLHIDRFGPFGHRTFTWPVDEIRAIRVADSGTEVNGRKLRQVKIVAQSGKAQLGIMTGRTASELSSVATAMRDALGLKQES